jgi:adenosine kinase
MPNKIEVLGLGNSLVDLIESAEDSFLEAKTMVKGAMTLIDEPRAEQLYESRSTPRVVSGGSAANTIYGVASFGVPAAYIGKVKNDPLGAAYIDDIRASGVRFSTAPANEGPGTGRCFIYVTPDGERTMNTYLGASSFLTPDDVDDELVRQAPIIYLEGYMWDRPAAKAAFQKAGKLARAAGHRAALTLSDSFCVGRFRSEFLDLMRTGTVDTLFANTDEILSLYETNSFTDAVAALRREGVLAFVTRSEKGAIAIDGDTSFEAPAAKIDRLVDTTGAGDYFAAGCLAGLARGASLTDCMRLGALGAADVIQRIGARPSRPLRELAAAGELADVL